ncbi:hypothetical protein KEM56_005975 [Ascosphaera pollenicola]|nr:hypothetical protein KEM56_005975 [Ascosphaera pollenicola]
MKVPYIHLLALASLPLTSARRVWKAPAAEKEVFDGKVVDTSNRKIVVARGLPDSVAVSTEELPLIMYANDAKEEKDIPASNQVILPDVLGKERGLNIFASLTRYIDDVSARLSNPSLNTTVLAPTNSALQKLQHKPWESGYDYTRYGEVAAYKGDAGQGRADKNLRAFVESHVVPVSPWMEAEEVETLAGRTVYWEKRDDEIYIQPGNLKVERIATRTANGEVWILDDVIRS